MVKDSKSAASLRDYIDYDLKCLSVGLNPSIMSVQLGFYFANPRNRFWRAFNQARVVEMEVLPDAGVHEILMREWSIGFTDVVKRASRMGNELRAADFKRDAPILRAKIEQYNPKLLWFHGKVAAGKFLQYAYGIKYTMNWGINDIGQLATPLYITPNPSPANAAYSLEVLVEYYRDLITIYR